MCARDAASGDLRLVNDRDLQLTCGPESETAVTDHHLLHLETKKDPRGTQKVLTFYDLLELRPRTSLNEEINKLRIVRWMEVAGLGVVLMVRRQELPKPKGRAVYVDASGRLVEDSLLSEVEVENVYTQRCWPDLKAGCVAKVTEGVLGGLVPVTSFKFLVRRSGKDNQDAVWVDALEDDTDVVGGTTWFRDGFLAYFSKREWQQQVGPKTKKKKVTRHSIWIGSVEHGSYEMKYDGSVGEPILLTRYKDHHFLAVFENRVLTADLKNKTHRLQLFPRPGCKTVNAFLFKQAVVVHELVDAKGEVFLMGWELMGKMGNVIELPKCRANAIDGPSALVGEYFFANCDGRMAVYEICE